MLHRTQVSHAWKWAKRGPRVKNHLKRLMLNQPAPKPVALRDPRVWTQDKSEMKCFDAPEWDSWAYRSRAEDSNEALQPIMDMPESLKKRMYDVPWWANPFGSWYLNNVLRVELIKLGKEKDGVRSYAEKIDIYRQRKLNLNAGTSFDDDDEKLIKKIIAERWRTLEFGERDRGHPCTYADYVLFLNEWFKSLDEEGRQRLREHFDKNIRPLLSVMSPSDISYLEAKTQNTLTPEAERRAAMYSTLGTPEFLDMSQRLKYEINEDYKVRDELGPEMFALWSKAPERWPPERLAKMYSLDFTLVRKILVWHHFKACYDSCVEPDWTLPKRLFALEWVRDVRARQQGRFYGRMRFAENKVSFLSDRSLFKDFVNRREASYENVWEMDDPYRFLQTEQDLEDYFGDNYDMYRRLFPEMTGRAGEPVMQMAKMPIWAGPHAEPFRKSPHNWLFAEIGINVGHEPLKKLELDPTNPKRRRFVVCQPDSTMRTAKLSEQRAWYWKEQWADFRFWTPHLEWGQQDTPSTESYQELHRSTSDADIRRGHRVATQPTKWFYESHYTRTGSADIMSSRHKDKNTTKPVVYPAVVNPAQVQMKNKPLLKTYRMVPEV
eukprot:PhM_4_TR17739/c1_g1_i1/m.58326